MTIASSTRQKKKKEEEQQQEGEEEEEGMVTQEQHVIGNLLNFNEVPALGDYFTVQIFIACMKE